MILIGVKASGFKVSWAVVRGWFREHFLLDMTSHPVTGIGGHVFRKSMLATQKRFNALNPKI